MNKNQKIALVILALVLTFISGICCGFFLANGSNRPAAELESQISVSSFSDTSVEQTTTSSSQETTTPSESENASFSESETTSNPGTVWLKDGFNYLAIGNSITKHGISSYWWNEVGMAASDAGHDYFHLVLKYLEENNDKVKGVSYNFYIWETQSHDRDEALSMLDQYLSPDLDLITVQLGENASNLSTYQNDFLSMLQYLRSKSPDARILVIGDFWINENRDELKKAAVQEAGVEYVSLEGIANIDTYYCGLGTTVYDADGNEHTVEHEGVAKHPGDAGMKAIADRIIEKLT